MFIHSPHHNSIFDVIGVVSFGDMCIGGDENHVVPRSLFIRNSIHVNPAGLAVQRPRGSSARMMAGLLINARAMATRCCCPPKVHWVYGEYVLPTPPFECSLGFFTRLISVCRSRQGQNDIGPRCLPGSKLKLGTIKPTLRLRIDAAGRPTN